MIEVKLHNPVANESRAWMYCWDGYEGVFSLEFVQHLFKSHPEETDFKFNIHCPGGEVQEGLAIYDCLRTSGKNIHMNIEGDCHSMAVALLLAAPKENRTANPNCTALIHKVYGCSYSGTADELEAQAKETRMLQNKILDIYADRTDMNRETLEGIMNQEIAHNASELLSWGFISKINSYNTNYKSNHKFTMNVNQIKKDASALLNKIQQLVGGAAASNYEFVDADGNVLFTTDAETAELAVGTEVSVESGTFTLADGRVVVVADSKVAEIQDPAAENFDHVDADGNVLFTTESEDDTLEVGMAATPDGEFELPDGRTVVIAEGEITEIREKEAEDPEEIQNLRAENENLRILLSEAQNLIKEMKKNLKSNYVPGSRIGSSASSNKGNAAAASAERKNAVKEALHGNK